MTVGVAAAAFAAAVRVTLCAVPGVSLSVAGLAVTPAGSPVMATATEPLNEFSDDARTLTLRPVAPPTMVNEVGDTLKVKSGAAVTAPAMVAECVSALEVPVSVRVKLPVAAAGAAVSARFCGVPGVRVSVAGFAVTPAGRPLTATATFPVKPSAGTALTLICWAEPPAVRVRVAGEAVSEKSGGGPAGEIVAAITAEWLRVPEVPVSVTVKLAADAVESAASVRLFAVPGVRVSVDGFALTPAGRPPTATFTVSAKPLDGTALRLICCPAPPGTRAIVAGAEVSEKSAAGVVDVEDDAVLELVPQEVSASKLKRQAA